MTSSAPADIGGPGSDTLERGTFLSAYLISNVRILDGTGRGRGACPRLREFERELEASVEVVAHMRKRGIRVLPGGDYGFPATPHGTYARDLWIFVKILGFSAMETLVTATRLGGELMGRPGKLGVVKAGALADLLLVDGDPLADIAILQDRNALRMIMKGGAPHKGRAG